MADTSALEVTLTNLFYDYMSSDHIEKFENEEVEDTLLTPVDLLHQQTIDALEENRNRQKAYKEALEGITDQKVIEVLNAQMKPLLDEEKHLINSSFVYMKKLYEKTGELSYSRNEISIPLYDNIFASTDNVWKVPRDNEYRVQVHYLFYDDLGVLNGKYDQYKELEPSQRRAFILANTEITHISIVFNDVSFVSIKGKIQKPENPLGIELFKAVPI